MASYTPFIPLGDVNPECAEGVKQFILGVARNEQCSYPSGVAYMCIIQRNLTRMKVDGGSYWEMKSSGIYVAHSPNTHDMPMWAPPVLSCIALSWKLGNDPDVKAALMEITCRMAADLFRPMRQSLIESAGGLELTTLAINEESRAIAALFPADPNDPDSVPIARLPVSGETVNLNDPGWFTFPLQ